MRHSRDPTPPNGLMQYVERLILSHTPIHLLKSIKFHLRLLRSVVSLSSVSRGMSVGRLYGTRPVLWHRGSLNEKESTIPIPSPRLSDSPPFASLWPLLLTLT